MSERRSELKAVASGDEMTAAKMAERDVLRMTTRMMEGWSEFNSRLLTMAQESMRTTMSAAEEMRQCQTPREVLDCQMKLARQSIDDCVDGYRQIGDLMARMSSDAMGYMGLPR